MYQYPPELCCEKCREFVSPVLRDREAAYTHQEKGDFTIRYRAALCPACGSTLCERDQEYAFLDYLKGADHFGKERSDP